MIQLQLQESYCLPLFTYAFPTLNVNVAHILQLNVCWNSVLSTSTSTICGDACPLSCASAEAYKLAQCTRPQGWGS